MKVSCPLLEYVTGILTVFKDYINLGLSKEVITPFTFEDKSSPFNFNSQEAPEFLRAFSLEANAPPSLEPSPAVSFDPVAGAVSFDSVAGAVSFDPASVVAVSLFVAAVSLLAVSVVVEFSG